MKIYLLEDNTIFTREFCKLLKRKEIEYITCDSVGLYKFEKVDYYMIDLQIGSEMSYDVIKDIRSKTNKHIVLISHHNDRKKIKRAIECWVTYMIPKYEYELYWTHIDMIENLILREKNI